MSIYKITLENLKEKPSIVYDCTLTKWLPVLIEFKNPILNQSFLNEVEKIYLKNGLERDIIISVKSIIFDTPNIITVIPHYAKVMDR